MIAGRSISSRLTIWFSSIFFTGLILFGGVMWFDLKDTLLAGRSRTLDRRADRLAELLNDIQHDPPADRARKFQAFGEATGGGLIEVFAGDGTHVFPAPSSTAEAFPWPKFQISDRDQFRQVTFSGQTYLVLHRPIRLPTGELAISVAASLEGNRPILRTFSAGLLWTAPALLALSALGGYLLSRRALKPVDQITAATRSISVSNLSERLPIPETRDELQRLSETCNAMLARLESAVTEIQRFTADASHELRSPLAFMCTVAEVALQNRQADPESRRAFEEIVEECEKAKRLLEDMLTLARADAGTSHLAFEPLDLGEVVTAVCDKASLLATAREHRLTVSVDAASHLAVWGDFPSLRRLVWILVENAIKYSPEPGEIEIRLSATADQVTLVVGDHGIGISSSDLPHIFERFYRADPSRSQVEGSGLGLAIAKWIADVHRAKITVQSVEAMGSVFQVLFPKFAQTFAPTLVDRTAEHSYDRLPQLPI